ncbi:BON domain-containing protein [Pseudomonas sp. CAU 1711]|uniref:BON domain-containing protein n=1 Tax=Pseudomonas sp. CAU 1711 TaxID=3140356 RepID=UPI003260B652
MYQMKKLALATLTAGMLGLSPLAAQAADSDLSRQLSEARQEGSIWTAIALNRHLSPFSIEVDVENGVAVLSGKVESDVDRDLAEQLALGTEGVKQVDNRLQVDPGTQPSQQNAGLAQQFDDATLTAMVKSKLLWNSNTEGLDIDVDTRSGVVTLKGHARSAEAKELAGRLAENTKGVERVDNHLSVAGDGTAGQAQKAAQDTSRAISDAWITSKVKSSYLYDSQLDGLDISVETKAGMVELSGSVLNAAEKELAIEIARNIRGVRGVDADALQIGG